MASYTLNNPNFFDAQFYLTSNPDIAATWVGDPFDHYLQFGAAEQRAPSAWFDAAFYRAQYADVQQLADANLLIHYDKFGVDEGRVPNATFVNFDAVRYLRENPDVATFVNDQIAQGGFGGSTTNGATAHFFKFGQYEFRQAYDKSGATITPQLFPEESTLSGAHDANNPDVTVLPLNTNSGHTDLVGNGVVVDGDAPAVDNDGKVITPNDPTTPDTLRLIGDAHTRIDFTNPGNQLRGIDLNGDGTLATNGVENNVSGAGIITVKNFEIVDAYARNPLNDGDRANNYAGDIAYDGTGFGGDGVSTDGNIYLGGRGVDDAFGGIGNDFLAGGGIAPSRFVSQIINGVTHAIDTRTGQDAVPFIGSGSGIVVNPTPVDQIHGGRNADFGFVDLSALDPTDGLGLYYDGGETADNIPGTSNVNVDPAGTTNDRDWVLLEASDDDEPTTVVLTDSDGIPDADGIPDTDGDGLLDDGSITTRSGQAAILDGIESVDASGNLYGFLNNVEVKIGQRAVDDRSTDPVAGTENYGLGSTAQLVINGSGSANIVVAGYDNDTVNGDGGNDLLFGGNLGYLLKNQNNPNLLDANGGLDLNVSKNVQEDGSVVNTVTDGVDVLNGDAGDDGIVLELDHGVIDGGNGRDVDSNGDGVRDDNDTLWITNFSTGRTQGWTPEDEAKTPTKSETDTLAALTKDDILRLDLGYATTQDDTTGYRGYRGFDDNGRPLVRPGTADQSNYLSESSATTIVDMENIDATGLGAVDYYAAGTNNPELNFANHQNHAGSHVDMELRGTDFNGVLNSGNNFLLAGTGDDVLEGRGGNDTLEGNQGNDTFVFSLNNGDFGVDSTQLFNGVFSDGVDIIRRKLDTNGDGFWDAAPITIPATPPNVTQANVPTNTPGVWGQDFGDNTTAEGGSNLTIQFRTVVDGATKAVDLAASPLASFHLAIPAQGQNPAVTFDFNFQAPNFGSSLGTIQTAFTTAFGLDAEGKTADGNIQFLFTTTAVGAATDIPTIIVHDNLGRTVDVNDISQFAAALINAQSSSGAFATYAPLVDPSAGDHLVYKSYDDRHDNEGVDDNAVLGSRVSLGTDAYAEDLVIDFQKNTNASQTNNAADTSVSTNIAEDQAYTIKFGNLATEDVVTVNINGLTYSLQVGKALDGSLIPGEDVNAPNTQVPAVQAAFLTRLTGFIDGFADTHTAAGAVDATFDGVDTITLSQRTYNGEETVFMRTPVVTLDNRSGGEQPTAGVTNVSQHQVTLLDFDGRNNALNQDNVLFVGQENFSRAVLATAKADGGELLGSDAGVIFAQKGTTITGSAQNNALDGVNQIEFSHDAKGAPERNLTTSLTVNYAVHGDDLLLGGDGADIIKGGTGDDRILGSKGADVLDGGKDLYLQDGVIQVYNDYEAAQARLNPNVVKLEKIDQNENGTILIPGFEDTLQFQQADFTPGQTRFTITLSDDLEKKLGGAGTVAVDLDGDGKLDAPNKTAFTNFEHIRTISGVGNDAAGTPAEGGGGQGQDTLDVEALSTKAGGITYVLGAKLDVDDPVAGKGVEDDAGKVYISTGGYYVHVTDPSVPPDPTKFYQTTNTTGIWDDKDALPDTVYATVDGVENVIGGAGNDTLFIDSSENPKDNLFAAGTGDNDAIIYNESRFLADQSFTFRAVPSVTVTVNAGADTDTVTMTAGRNGLVKATDTLVSVETIDFLGGPTNAAGIAGGNGGTAVPVGSLENDALELGHISGGAVADFVRQEVSLAPSSVGGVPGAVQVNILGITELENVLGSGGNDTVIVADNMVNAREDSIQTDPGQTPTTEIGFNSYLNYDYINDTRDLVEPFDGKADDLNPKDGKTFQRMSLGELRTLGTTDGNPFDARDIPQVINQDEYTFDLKGGTDTVDYSNETGKIVAVVNTSGKNDIQHVLVDQNAVGPNVPDGYVPPRANPLVVGGDDGRAAVDLAASPEVDNYRQASDRIDALKNVENIVAAQGQSTLDLTQSDRSLEIRYLRDPSYRIAEFDREVFQVRLSDLASGTPITGTSLNYLEYWDTSKVDTAKQTAIVQPTADWNRIEGSDKAEVVVLNSVHSFSSDLFNLRGGANEVKYNELTRSISAVVNVDTFDKTNPTQDGKGQIHATVNFQDGNGAALAGGGTHNIYSYSADNLIAPGSLRIAASQDAEDTVQFTGNLRKLFILGERTATDNIITVKVGSGAAENSVVLTGFELLQDANAVAGGAPSDDVYNIANLSNVLSNLTLVDSPVADHDALQIADDVVGKEVAGGTGGAADRTVNLDSLSAANPGLDPTKAGITPFGFNFEVLDLTGKNSAGATQLTATNLELTGRAASAVDELVAGKLSQIASVKAFSSLVLTDASTDKGTALTLDLDAGQLKAGATKLFDFDGNELSAGGLLHNSDANTSYVAPVATGLNLTVVDTTPGAGATVVGGAGNDTLIGGAGNDTLRGGAGNDILDGGIVPAKGAIVSVTLPGATPGGDVATIGAAGNTVAISGVTITAAAAPANSTQVAVNADADQVGAAFAAQPLATWKAALAATPGFAGAAGNEDANQLLSVTYDVASNKLLFSFAATGAASSVDQADFTVTGGGTIVPVLGDERLFTPQQESVDTFVFEKTAALNGVDSISNFSSGVVNDILNFEAFLGRVVTAGGIVGPVNGLTAGLDLTGKDIGVVFNRAASLSSADLSTTPAAGRISIADNGTAVVLVTADADGLADATDEGYSAYYVWDANDKAGETDLRVQLVDPIKSSTGQDIPAIEMANLAHFVAGAAPIDVAPTITGAENITGPAGSALALPDLVFTDPDSNLTVTVNGTGGTVNGLTDADPAAPGIQLIGTPAQVTAAFGPATFTGIAPGAASVVVSANDGVNALVTSNIGITLVAPNVAPTITGATDVTGAAASVIALPDLAFVDPDSNLSVTVTATGGTVGGLVDADPAAAGIQLTGTPAEVGTAFAAATFTGGVAGTPGTGSVVVSATDGVNTPATATIGVTLTAGGQDVTAGGNFTATDGVVDTFVYNYNTVAGRATTAAGAGVATITGFNVNEDILQFDNLDSAVPITEAQFLATPGVVPSENGFAVPPTTTFNFDPNADIVVGGVTIVGIADAGLAQIEVLII